MRTFPLSSLSLKNPILRRKLLVAICFLGMCFTLGCLLLKGGINNPNHNRKQESAEEAQAMQRLYLRVGYTLYQDPTEVPWQDCFAAARPWDDEEAELLSSSASLIAHVMGRNDPSLRALPLEGEKGDETVILALLPFDARIAIRIDGHVDFIDSVWVPSTRTLYLHRSLLARSQVLTACELFQASRRAISTATPELAQAVDEVSLNAEIESALTLFCRKADAFLSKQPGVDVLRHKAELRVIQDFFEGHKRKVPSALALRK